MPLLSILIVFPLLAALILAMNPSLQPDEVREILETSADDLGAPGRDRETGFGRINALRALLYAAPWNFYARGAGSYSATLDPATQLSFPLIMKDVNGWRTTCCGCGRPATDPPCASVTLSSGRRTLRVRDGAAKAPE